MVKESLTLRYACPKCHVISDVPPSEYTLVCEYSEVGTCRPSWAKVSFKRLVCPVCGRETEIETGRDYTDRRPKRVDRISI